MATIFTKIIQGDIPSYKIYEDEYTYAFLDIFPQHPGHSLIVPKCEVDHFVDVPEPYYSAIFQTAKKIAPALQKATNCTRVCTTFLGYEVPHCHYHLIPTNSLSDMDHKTREQADASKLKQIQEKILSFL